MQKVKLPREVVDALNRAKFAHPTWNAHDLFYIIINPSGFCQYKNDIDIGFIQKWAYRCHELTLAKALLNDYEVEETPEEIIKKLHETPPFTPSPKDYRNGIIDTLNVYGIKIKGVNDHE